MQINPKLSKFLVFAVIIALSIIAIIEIWPLIESNSQLFSTHNMIQAFFLIGLLFYIGYSFFKNNSSTKISQHLFGWLIWGIIFMLVIVGYAFRYELDNLKKRVLTVLIPSYTWVEDGQITLAKHNDGHFYIDAIADGQAKIKFLIDTGASGIAITKKDAINMGFDLTKLKYTQASSTANGIAYSAPIKIKRLQIGKKIFHDISAHVTSGGLDVSLLGMSAIEDFSDFRFIKDNLILKY